jgi:hypothetical protein
MQHSRCHTSILCTGTQSETPLYRTHWLTQWNLGRAWLRLSQQWQTNPLSLLTRPLPIGSAGHTTAAICPCNILPHKSKLCCGSPSSPSNLPFLFDPFKPRMAQAVSTCHLCDFFSFWMSAGTSMSWCSRPMVCRSYKHTRRSVHD